MYHLTHPVDLSKFLKYIDDSEPFDLVIDGMNLFFVPVKMRRMAEHKKAGVSVNKGNPTQVESIQQRASISILMWQARFRFDFDASEMYGFPMILK